MDVSLLLLVTPVIPAPVGDPGVLPLAAPVVGAAPPRADPCGPPGGAPPRCVPGAPPCGAATLSKTGAKSSLVIGSLNFLRRNFCSTRKSMLGGSAPTLLRCKRLIARAYCSPRNT